MQHPSFSFEYQDDNGKSAPYNFPRVSLCRLLSLSDSDSVLLALGHELGTDWQTSFQQKRESGSLQKKRGESELRSVDLEAEMASWPN